MRILLIEDSVRLQASIQKGLTRAGYAVDAVDTGERGLIFVRRNYYDLVVLDLMLPGMNGLEFLRQVRNEGGDAHVLILTAKESVEDRVRGLQCGADDYMSKPFSFDELLARVQAIVRRKYQSKAPQMIVGDLVIDTVARNVSRGGTDVALSKREFGILEYLARRRGEAVSRMEMEDHLYGETNLPSSNAVDSAICTLRRKLDQAGAEDSRLIQTLHGVGYVLDEASA